MQLVRFLHLSVNGTGNSMASLSLYSPEQQLEDLPQQLLDSLTTAILVLDQDLAVSYLNPAAEYLLDCSDARATGQPLESLFAVPLGDIPHLEEQMKSRLPFNRRALEIPLPNGKTITVDLAFTPLDRMISFPDDKVHTLVELQGLDRLLRISREETFVSSQTTSRSLIRGLAHEIKNPLGGIRGAAQLLGKELADNELADYTRVIIEEADRLRNLVDKLLGPNRAAVMRQVNVHEVVERVCTLLQAEASDIQIIRDYDPSIPDIKADAEQLIQAVLNVARNARQALASMPESHVACLNLRTRIVRQFTIGAIRHPLVVRLDIIDNGPGINPELMDSVFYPMVSGRPEGSGLGLSIAQAILHRHQGLIECLSEPGHTEFSLYIPLEPSTNDS